MRALFAAVRAAIKSVLDILDLCYIHAADNGRMCGGNFIGARTADKQADIRGIWDSCDGKSIVRLMRTRLLFAGTTRCSKKNFYRRIYRRVQM